MSGRCAMCGEPGHRYGTTDQNHKPDATACVNGLRYKVEQLEAEVARLHKALDIWMWVGT